MSVRFNPADFIGQNYNGVIILSFSHYKVYTKSRTPFFNCKCHCGNEKVLNHWDLKLGKVSSCGCLRTTNAIANETALKNLLNIYKNGAKRRNYNFQLSFLDFKNLTEQNCFYCNSKPKCIYVSKQSKCIYNGVDRKDNTQGYTLDNCVPCCKICNRAKSDLPYNEFLEWIERIKTFTG